ncbi:class I SAM-dependent methyltransferase [Carnobacteriaceae bacterium zg-C25]|nr:class I SAM-dependent methyltransferase [Carnobacteriaceae bacterium zg-C25]
MTQDKVLRAFEVFQNAVELLHEDVKTSYLEAMAETLQNCVYDYKAQQIDGLPSSQTLNALDGHYTELKAFSLDATQWRKVIQFTFLNAIKNDNIQANHHITPDTIGNLLLYFIQQLVKSDIRLLDITAGAGNLVTLLSEGLKERLVHATAFEVDDVLVSLLAMSSQLQNQLIDIKHQDAVLPLLTSTVNVVASDLPIGYYPKDDVAKEYQVSVSKEHTYAHHLLIENALNHLEDNGWAFFIVPSNVFDTNQAPQLLALLTQQDYFMQAFLTLPKTLFKQESAQKAILMVQRNGERAKKADQVLLGEIPSFKDVRAMQGFVERFSKWASQF